MLNKLASILFLMGILMLIVVHIYFMRKGKSCSHKSMVLMSITVVISIILIGGGWIIRENTVSEKYGKDYMYQRGKLLGSSVFASDPENVPGIGWIN